MSVVDERNESVLDVYLYEASQLLEQLESIVLECEKANAYPLSSINDVFRAMHTLKGSAAMMQYTGIASLAHAMEDLFFYLREDKPALPDCSVLSDLVLQGVDFVKVELHKIRSGEQTDGDPTGLCTSISAYLRELKGESSRNAPGEEAVAAEDKPVLQRFEATFRFEDGCEMENVRAFNVMHQLLELAEVEACFPEHVLENEQAVELIRETGFRLRFRTSRPQSELEHFFGQMMYVCELELQPVSDAPSPDLVSITAIASDSPPPDRLETEASLDNRSSAVRQSMISVHVAKLDRLMDLVSELVIAEAMVTRNPELQHLELPQFHKAARLLRKISGELQDTVMAIRMVPLAATLHKMHRLVRDMSKELGKSVRLEIIGEETEVDKNIIETISDPLMHLVRNAIDHGIESEEERVAAGKPASGTIRLEAKNAGGDVLILVRDDGKGLDRKKILRRAEEQGLLARYGGMLTDKDIYQLIFLPGFSTKDAVTAYSGRGVGMDVVANNLQAIGGTITVDSTPGEGTQLTLKIPLTLAIIDGMNLRVGHSTYTLPTTSIRESFRPRETDLIRDPDGNEMILVRGRCYPVLRLHERYRIADARTRFSEGVLVMMEDDGKSVGLFVDELVGQQQVVVKALPDYFKMLKPIEGIAGCTLLGDGSCSLILDAAGLVRLSAARTLVET